MTNTQEKQILTIIKFTPPLFIIFVAISITLFLFFDNQQTFIKEKERIEQDYIQTHKQIIKGEVKRVHDYINYLQKSTETQLKKNIKDRVYEAHGIAMGIYKEYQHSKSKEEIFDLIKTSLSSLRYNDGRGYFFVDNVKGVKVIYPIDKNIENRNFYDFADAKGYKFVRTIVQTIKDKTEQFDEYYWYKPNQGKKSFRKISFYKYFEPLNLAIGSGEYFDEYEQAIKQKSLDYINLIRYGKNGYIFVINYDSIYLSHIRKSYIGKSAITNNDTIGIKKVIEDLTQIAKNGSGFYSYVQNQKPDTNLATTKFSYVEGQNDWGWMIGTGFYEDDLAAEISKRKNLLDEKFKQNIQNILIIASLLTLMLLFISMYISRLLENKFGSYKLDINKQQTLLYQQSKMAAMGEMIGNIAHQWRQPLSSISTASTGAKLQKDMNILNDDAFDDAMETINNSAQYLSQTIDDFRNFFSHEKELKKFTIEESIDKTFSLITGQFKVNSIQIIRHIENIELNTYEKEFIQSLINILNNAKDELIKNNDEHARYIFITAYTKNNQAILIIRDNAGGIDKKHLDRVFEPYFTTKHQSQGTGIGLYMTQEIITKHLKGRIYAYNVEFIHDTKFYKGAEFKIILDI